MTVSPFRCLSLHTSSIRQGSNIDIHIFSNHVSSITAVLDDEQLRYCIDSIRRDASAAWRFVRWMKRLKWFDRLPRRMEHS